MNNFERQIEEEMQERIEEACYITETMPPNLTKMSFLEMADLINLIWLEMKRRNPIGINFYEPDMLRSVEAVKEIHYAELDNPTCEEGPSAN